MLCLIAQINKESQPNGKGKEWDENGDTYIGQYKNGDKTNGKHYEMQTDGTYTLFEWPSSKVISRGHKSC